MEIGWGTIAIALIINALILGGIIYVAVQLALKKVIGIMEGYAMRDKIPLHYYLTKEQIWNLVVQDPKKYGLSYPIDESGAEFKEVLEKLRKGNFESFKSNID